MKQILLIREREGEEDLKLYKQKITNLSNINKTENVLDVYIF